MRIAILASREVKRNKPYRVRRMGKTWCFGETATEKNKGFIEPPGLTPHLL